MKITLTYAEGRAVRSRVGDLLAGAMLAQRKHTWHRSHVYTLPACAWKKILLSLTDIAYGPRGGKAYKSRSLYTAIAKIAKAIREWELHPAFRPGSGVVGIDGTVVPGWLYGDGQRDPYPVEGGEFVLFCPRHHFQRGRDLTSWEPDGSCSAASENTLHREEFHLIFVAVGEEFL